MGGSDAGAPFITEEEELELQAANAEGGDGEHSGVVGEEDAEPDLELEPDELPFDPIQVREA